MASTKPLQVGLWDTYAPNFLSTTGPYGSVVIKAGTVFSYVQAFIICNFTWLKSTTGAKTLLFKIPEAIVRVSIRLKDSESLPARTFHFLSPYAKPFAMLGGGCGKTVLAFMELRSKLDRIKQTYYAPEPISYVVFDKANTPQIRQFKLSLWEQYADCIGSSADWLMSVAECENFLHTAFDIKRGPFLSPLASYSGYVLSLRTLYIEGSFLYQTVKLHNMQGAATENPIPEEKVSKLIIAGSLLKIALAIVSLTLDFFGTLGKRENKPYWLAPANFWLSLVPSLLAPLVYNWWPTVAVEPIKVQAQKNGG